MKSDFLREHKSKKEGLKDSLILGTITGIPLFGLLAAAGWLRYLAEKESEKLPHEMRVISVVQTPSKIELYFDWDGNFTTAEDHRTIWNESFTHKTASQKKEILLAQSLKTGDTVSRKNWLHVLKRAEHQRD